MGDMLQADINALRAMAAAIRAEADSIAVIDPVDLIARVGLAMPNSAIGTAAATAGAPLLSAYQGMGERLRALSDAADRSTTTYAEADREFADQLDEYLPSSPR
ncbi:UDP-glucose 4-epimerase [Nocardia sp. NPDC051030]|uniref:UDP-glucose 4-epimerase n=1 Tax=Nocardia sp. NPDC051030 TaxID=3155162 RepID=UPI0034368BE0